jgi:transcriptional regulator with XRE-family HTH domain
MDENRRTIDLKGLGEYIRARRRKLGLTQTALGERLGWVQERISVLETGKYGTPSLPALATLAQALEAPLSELLTACGLSEAVSGAERAVDIGVETASGRTEAVHSTSLQIRALAREKDRLVNGLDELNSRLRTVQANLESANMVRVQVAARRQELHDLMVSMLPPKPVEQ